MRALLDINVLIALLDSAHVHHKQAHTWLAGAQDSGWATCPITQNGVIRVMSQPAYPGGLKSAEVAERLREAADSLFHEFWPDDLSLLDRGVLNWAHMLGHRQVTDAYLLALAVGRGGRFVTLDRRISPAAVAGASARHLVTLIAG